MFLFDGALPRFLLEGRGAAGLFFALIVGVVCCLVLHFIQRALVIQLGGKIIVDVMLGAFLEQKRMQLARAHAGDGAENLIFFHKPTFEKNGGGRSRPRRVEFRLGVELSHFRATGEAEHTDDAAGRTADEVHLKANIPGIADIADKETRPAGWRWRSGWQRWPVATPPDTGVVMAESAAAVQVELSLDSCTGKLDADRAGERISIGADIGDKLGHVIVLEVERGGGESGSVQSRGLQLLKRGVVM